MEAKWNTVYSFLWLFATLFAAREVNSQQFQQRVNQAYRSCCVDRMPQELGSLRALRCYFTAGINLNKVIHLFSHSLVFKMHFDGKTLVAVDNGAPVSIVQLGMRQNEDVYAAIQMKYYTFVETLTPQMEIFMYTYDMKKGLTGPARMCAHGCIGLNNKFQLQALNEATTGKLIIGSAVFQSLTADNKNVSIVFVPTTSLEDPFDFKQENIQRYEDGMKPLDSDTKPKGQFHTYATIVVETKNEVEYYYVFHRYNWACFMTRKATDNSVIYDYPEPTFNTILPQCQRTQEFFGCPQSFCYNHAVDDILFGTVDGGTRFVLFRGEYHWYLALRESLPMEFPRVSYARLTGVNSKPWPKMENFKYIDAAEAVNISGQQLIVIFKGENLLTFYNNQAAVLNIAAFFKQRIPGRVESAWFHPTENSLYLFYENKFQVYTFAVLNNQPVATLAGSESREIGSEMPGLPSVIDAAISLSKQVAYFLNGGYYYKITLPKMEKPFLPVPTFDPNNRFFDTLGDPCKIDQNLFNTEYLPKLEQFVKPKAAKGSKTETKDSGDAQGAPNESEDTEGDDDEPAPAKQKKATEADSEGGGGGIIFIVIGVIVGLIIAVVVVVAGVTYMKSREPDYKPQPIVGPIAATLGKKSKASSFSPISQVSATKTINSSVGKKAPKKTSKTSKPSKKASNKKK